MAEIPLGSYPDWELRNHGGHLNTIPESSTLLLSLKRSRKTWLEALKFPRESKDFIEGFRETVTVTAGPHIFYATEVFMRIHRTKALAALKSIHWQPFWTTADSDALSDVESTNFAYDVARAASRNSQLTELLMRHKKDQSLSEEEEETLLSMLAQLHTSPKRFSALLAPPNPEDIDIILRFKDSKDARSLPQVAAVIEKSSETFPCDIVLSLRTPFNENEPANGVATIRFENASSQMWVGLMQWIGDEKKMAQHRKVLDSIKQEQKRTFIAHRLPSGKLLEAIKSEAKPEHSIKPLDPSRPPIKPKRPGQAVARQQAVPGLEVNV